MRALPTLIFSRTQASFAGRTCRRRFHPSPLPRGVYKNADRQTYTKVVEAKDRLALVDFYADWCGPCRQLSPVLEKLCSDPSFKSGVTKYPVDLVAVDVESEDGAVLAREFGVTVLPTVFALENGKPVDQFKGALPESAVRKFVDKL